MTERKKKNNCVEKNRKVIEKKKKLQDMSTSSVFRLVLNNVRRHFLYTVYGQCDIDDVYQTSSCLSILTMNRIRIVDEVFSIKILEMSLMVNIFPPLHSYKNETIYVLITTPKNKRE